MHRTVSLVTAALGLLGGTVTLTGAAVAAPPSASAATGVASVATVLAAAPQANPGVAQADPRVALAGPGAPLAGPLLAAAPKKQCTVTDPRLRELSGLVVTKNGYIVINDSSEQENRNRVFYLNKNCEITKEVPYSGNGPFDTEDLALSPDGRTLWIADTGDNITSRKRRERVAVWSMPVNGSKQPTLHRLSYADGKPRDAEALLIGDDNLPLIITKVTAGKAEIFTPDGPLKSGDTEPVPMKRVGEVLLPRTDTENPLSTFGRVAITGAARSPDGSRVVLRTYADAFEYDVSNGDIVGALTTTTPRVTALADPFGEAIAYSIDGKTFLTVSDAGHLDDDDPVEILRYTPSTDGPKNLAQDPDAAKKSGQSFLDGLTLDEITYLVASVGVLGALLVGAGIFGILRARKRPAPPVKDRDGDGPAPGKDGGSGPSDQPRNGVYGGTPAGSVYGGSPNGERAGARSGPVYGGRTGSGGASRQQGGGVYGGGGRPAEAAPGHGGRSGGGRPAGGGPGGGVYGGAGRAGAGNGRAEPPPRPGRAEPPRGGRAEPPRGGRAEPPRRGGGPAEPDPRGRRPGRYREDDLEAYGQLPRGTYGYRGDRY